LKSSKIIDDKLEVVGTKGVAYVDSCDHGIRLVTGNKITYPDSRHMTGTFLAGFAPFLFKHSYAQNYINQENLLNSQILNNKSKLKKNLTFYQINHIVITIDMIYN